MFPNESTFIPVVGFEKINDAMQTMGSIAMLYTNKMRKTMDNSLGVFQNSCWPSINIIRMIQIVIVFVNRSHKIDAPQNIGRYTPLVYCINLALRSFSCFEESIECFHFQKENNINSSFTLI